jgi:hypothetical protein
MTYVDAIVGRMGVEVQFLLEGTGELLFKGPFQAPPRVDDLVSYSLDDGPVTTYKVESVTYVTRQRTIQIPLGQSVLDPLGCTHTPEVRLSVIP